MVTVIELSLIINSIQHALRQATCSGDFNFTEVTENKLTISLFDVEVVNIKLICYRTLHLYSSETMNSVVSGHKHLGVYSSTAIQDKHLKTNFCQAQQPLHYNLCQ